VASLATCHRGMKKREGKKKQERKIKYSIYILGSIYILTYKRILEDFGRVVKVVSDDFWCYIGRSGQLDFQ
jgi:hypothetical protein